MSALDDINSVKLKMSGLLRLIYGANAEKKIARSFNVSSGTAQNWLSGRIPLSDKHNFILWAAKVREELRRHKAEIEREEQWLNTLLDNRSALPVLGHLIASASHAVD